MPYHSSDYLLTVLLSRRARAVFRLPTLATRHNWSVYKRYYQQRFHPVGSVV
jgi:hypothetical protein